jgi:hypothetical protein
MRLNNFLKDQVKNAEAIIKNIPKSRMAEYFEDESEPKGRIVMSKYIMPDSNSITPPFKPRQKVVCIRLSKERNWRGQVIDVCRCTKGTEYKIDGCVWHYKFGWMVSISGELHKASDFTANREIFKKW